MAEGSRDAMTSDAGAKAISNFEKRVGHPPGLFMLFFAEMWERFSYYGMRALLVFYMTKGFLKYNDHDAYAVYGSYTSLVYLTPFIGGILADKFLGQRRAVVTGGLLMAAGHLMMTIEKTAAFYVALALLILGNGFFKPNISTVVGQMYGAHNKEKRDAGFTIFYMGINLGAAMSPLVCGYIGETYGWHYGFGLATFGMLVGLAVFAAPTRVTQLLIGAGALLSAVEMVATSLFDINKVAGPASLNIGSLHLAFEKKADLLLFVANAPVALALVVAAVFALWALNEGRLDPSVGQLATKFDVRIGSVIWAGSLILIPVAAFLVSSAAWSKHSIVLYILIATGLVAVAVIVVEALRSSAVARDRLFVVLAMCFFSMLFWSFFEQAGSSINNFTDRNVDRVTEVRRITEADVGKEVTLHVNQKQLGYTLNGKVFTLDDLDALRKEDQEQHNDATKITFTPDASHVGMGVEGAEVPASTFQAANPIFILVFGVVFSGIWAFMAKRKIEPSTPFKFALGLLQLGLGFGALWYGAKHADSRGMVGMSWLLLGYLLHTTGELCLSPIGLSMVTKLSPRKIVSMVMGAWFLATAFSQYLAGVIAQLTGVSGGDGDDKTVPPPLQTVHVYGDVFGKIAIAGCMSALLLFVLVPLIKKGMHLDEPMTGEGDGPGGH